MRNDSAGDASGSLGGSPVIGLEEPSSFRTTADVLADLRDQGYDDAWTRPAKYIIDRIGYDRLKPYIEMDAAAGHPYPSLKRAHDLLRLDRKVQAILLEYIGIYEMMLRCRIGAVMGEAYGPCPHADPRLFMNRERYDKIWSRYSMEANRAKVMSPETMPIWKATSFMSFGTLSKFYQNISSQMVRSDIAAFFGVGEGTLVSWTRCLNSVRNVCAHFDRLLGKKLRNQPSCMKGLKFTDNSNPIYAVFVLQRLLGTSEIFVSDLSLAYHLSLTERLYRILNNDRELTHDAGIPDEWDELLLSDALLGSGAMVGSSDDDLFIVVESNKGCGYVCMYDDPLLYKYKVLFDALYSSVAENESIDEQSKRDILDKVGKKVKATIILP